MWLTLPEAVLLLGLGAFVGAAVAGSFFALMWEAKQPKLHRCDG